MGEAKRRVMAKLDREPEPQPRQPGTLPLWIWVALFVGIVLTAAVLSPARSLGF